MVVVVVVIVVVLVLLVVGTLRSHEFFRLWLAVMRLLSTHMILKAYVVLQRHQVSTLEGCQLE